MYQPESPTDKNYKLWGKYFKKLFEVIGEQPKKQIKTGGDSALEKGNHVGYSDFSLRALT